MIDPRFWTDDKIMCLSRKARLLFIGIWNFSDDSGIHKDNALVLKAEIFPADEDISVADVERCKKELIDSELIIPYQNDELFYVKNWQTYQYIQKPVPSKYKLPEEYDTSTVGLPPNRIERNRMKIESEKKVTKKKVGESERKEEKDQLHWYEPSFNLEKLKQKYPKMDIDGWLKKFKRQSLSNEIEYDVNMEGFECYLEKELSIY